MNIRATVFLVFVACYMLNSPVKAEEEYQRVARDLHNEHRKRHHAAGLSLSEDLNNRAAQCAQYYADKGKIDHSCPHKNGAGENLWAHCCGNPSDVWSAGASINGWYSEEPRHDYNQDYQPSSGHFSQLVWNNSRELGFGTGRKEKSTYVCALYAPHGNLVGDFANNVFRP